jgi:ElaB/YqjD/DUF883 family membrane-anchored ribosome-binding protein
LPRSGAAPRHRCASDVLQTEELTMSNTSPSSNGTSGTSSNLSSYDGDSDSSSTASLRANLGQAGSHLKQAASHAGVAVKGAASAAGEEMRLGKANIKSELAESALSGIAAAEQATAAGREQVDALMDKGRDLLDSASELIRERPLASFGVAFATGWIIAKLARGSDR